MIDRLVHHADVLTLKGSSYRVKDIGIATLPSARADDHGTITTTTWPTFNPSPPAYLSTAVNNVPGWHQ